MLIQYVLYLCDFLEWWVSVLLFVACYKTSVEFKKVGDVKLFHLLIQMSSSLFLQLKHYGACYTTTRF